MKIFKKQIPVRHILYVVLGWLHATMLCVPLYALVLNFVSEGMTKDVILQNILRGFLILAPIALSWFAIKCLRRIFFYILASIGITVLTGFLFDSVLMAVVALLGVSLFVGLCVLCACLWARRDEEHPISE